MMQRLFQALWHKAAAVQNNEAARRIWELIIKSFGLYIHVPFCTGKCNYCAFYSIVYDRVVADRYLTAAEREIEMAPDQPRLAALDTVFFGGGTPTLLATPQLERLCAIPRQWRTGIREWTVEANPGTLDRDKLRVLRQAGVNRLSLGAQSFDDKILRKLGRRHSVEDVRTALGMARDAGFQNIGIDLIACVPGVSLELWRRTLDEAVQLRPEHISVYALTVEEGTSLEKMVAGGRHEVQDDDEQLDALHLAEKVLGIAGYRRYEISNYALPGYECLHNLSCWRGAEYLGIGPAASSHVDDRRWTNAADLNQYLLAIERGNEPLRDEECLSKAVKASEMMIFGLRMTEGVDVVEVRRRSGITEAGEQKIIALLSELSESGLVRRRNTGWVLTDRGRDLADYVAVELVSWESDLPDTR